MQTFITMNPLKHGWSATAHQLDDSRLNKQRVECKQILMILTGQTEHWKNPNAWAHHPAVIMWRGHIQHLAGYMMAIGEECSFRDIADNAGLNDWAENIYDAHEALHERAGTREPLPWWVGSSAASNRVLKTHRACLLAKKLSHYSQFCEYSSGGNTVSGVTGEWKHSVGYYQTVYRNRSFANTQPPKLPYYWPPMPDPYLSVADQQRVDTAHKLLGTS